MITAGARGTGVNPEVRVAQLQLERAQLDKRFATLTAPTRGVVTNLRLAVGQYVAPGTPAMTFIDARGAWITADLRENQLGNVQIGDAVGITFDAAPGTVFKGRVQSIAWGIDVGRSSPGGLLQNLPEGQWFEPARRIPVHIELDGSLEDWPRAVRIGGKAGVVIYAEGRSNPVAWLASGLMQVRAHPRSAASMALMSIFVISIMASNARLAAAGSGSVMARVRATGVICHDTPHLSLHQPHALACPPWPMIAFQ